MIQLPKMKLYKFKLKYQPLLFFFLIGLSLVFPNLVEAGRVYNLGFELNTTTANVEFDGTLEAAAAITSTAANVRSGTYAMQISSLSSGVKKGHQYRFTPDAGDNG